MPLDDKNSLLLQNINTELSKIFSTLKTNQNNAFTLELIHLLYLLSAKMQEFCSFYEALTIEAKLKNKEIIYAIFSLITTITENVTSLSNRHPPHIKLIHFYFILPLNLSKHYAEFYKISNTPNKASASDPALIPQEEPNDIQVHYSHSQPIDPTKKNKLTGIAAVKEMCVNYIDRFLETHTRDNQKKQFFSALRKTFLTPDDNPNNLNELIQLLFLAANIHTNSLIDRFFSRDHPNSWNAIANHFSEEKIASFPGHLRQQVRNQKLQGNKLTKNKMVHNICTIGVFKTTSFPDRLNELYSPPQNNQPPPAPAAF